MSTTNFSSARALSRDHAHVISPKRPGADHRHSRLHSDWLHPHDGNPGRIGFRQHFLASSISVRPGIHGQRGCAWSPSSRRWSAARSPARRTTDVCAATKPSPASAACRSTRLAARRSIASVPFHRLQRHARAIGNRHALPQIETRQRMRDLPAVIDVALFLRRPLYAS